MRKMSIEERKKLGNRIKQLRKQKGLSQQELADMIEYKVGTISKYEQGDRTPPYSMFYKLAQALDCNISDLTDEPRENVTEGYFQEQGLFHFRNWLMYNHLGGLEMNYTENKEYKTSLVVNVEKKSYDIYEKNEEIQKILLENFKTLVKIMGEKL